MLFKYTATAEIYTLSLHDALPIYGVHKSDRNILKPSSDTLNDRTVSTPPPPPPPPAVDEREGKCHRAECDSSEVCGEGLETGLVTVKSKEDESGARLNGHGGQLRSRETARRSAGERSLLPGRRG